jgi:hypothetical protein
MLACVENLKNAKKWQSLGMVLVIIVAAMIVLWPNRAEACGTKRYCGEMGSCAEASYHFRTCGLRRLDGDRDGIPCETLCGKNIYDYERRLREQKGIKPSRGWRLRY